MQRLWGFDENGEVFGLKNLVLRRIRDGYKAEVARLYRVYRENGLAAKGIVETVLREDGDLEHRKLVTSYPFEWPANMYKDAVLFHLGLFAELDKVGLTLKDALPNNILFDHTTPVFVDFLSLISIDKLKEEAWLNARQFADPRFAVVKRMLLPYMVLPFLFLARGEHGHARELLSSRSCNCDGKPPSWDELLIPSLRRSRRALRNYLKSLAVAVELIPIRYLSKSKGASHFQRKIERLIQVIGDFDATPPRSGYSSYYDEKREALSLSEPSSFLPKQKAVFGVLCAERPATVLDIGANTGWYSSLAASLGASVIALEQDESCVDILYERARRLGLRILPLKVSFSELTREIYGSMKLAPGYADRGLKEIPLYRAGVDRFRADLVLVLGLAHHLVLGEGYAIAEVVEILQKLCGKALVLEFVALNDEKIVTEPEFFGRLWESNASTYNLEKFIEIGRRHFASIEIIDSHPETRKILVFHK